MVNRIIDNDLCNIKLLFLLSLLIEIIQATDDKVYRVLHSIHLPTLSPVPSILHPKKQITLFVDNKYPSLYHSPV